jgi:hypothetical protein
MNRRQTDGAMILAVLYVIGYFCMVGALFFVDIPTNNKELVLTLAGIMSTVQAAILGYYFGASKQSEQLHRAPAPSTVSADSVDVTADTVKVEQR